MVTIINNMKDKNNEKQFISPELKPEKLYSQLASIPTISSGRFINRQLDPTSIQLDYSIRDHGRLTKLRARQSFHLIKHSDSPQIIDGTLEFIDAEINYQSLSPSGSKYAIFRTLTTPGKPPKKQFYLEIWEPRTNRQLVSHNLTSIHQSFLLNDTFGYPSWNSSESQIAYLAEITTEKDRASWLERNRYVPDFGEQLTGIQLPAIFVASIDDSIRDSNQILARIVQLTDQSTDLSRLVWGQPVFGPNSDEESVEIFCTGFASLSDLRRLGLIYCQNRPSTIHRLSFKIPLIERGTDQQALKLLHPADFTSHRISDPNRSARSPRVIEGKIIYLSNPIGGPHASCASLNMYEPKTNKDKVLVGPVDEPGPDGQFPGLYIDDLPSQPILCDPSDPQKASIVTSSIWGSLKIMLTIDLRSGEIKAHPPPCDGSCTVLNTNGGQQVLCVISQTDSSPQVWIGKLEEDSQFSWQKVTHLEASTDVQSQLSNLKSQIIKLPPNDLGPTEIVLTSPTSDLLRSRRERKTSLIILPHGGPHSTSLNEFSPSTAAMALLGHSIAYINYPGSLGFGQKWVEDLPKRLSIADVDSCKLALDHLLSLDLIKKLEIGHRIFVNGGSHGGFITAHLTSRYPGLFAAACMRNPVVDLVGTASGGSDIPDWSYAEANINFPLLSSGLGSNNEEIGKVSVNEIDFKILRDRSPIKFIQNVKTPTLILLGNQDRRVSNQQGLAWYHGLKSLKTEAELVLFEDNSHPLNSIYAELNSFMIWFEFLDSR
ncbi:hypothetical protein PGT21_015186 [Puccinia graminis f. sp. tritici]|uniref:acylaminoacyl-peptidase n=1 Tax=Puccinia graminis f. sp. tritici TaxID=56615 RepID=A0A5B0R1C1_PUCGR|nr:hypothetical protein PGT21_015186 [Puccinia graminis f. sp. tritici]KAA1122550.1 hypothetical protein PGTUg99_037781 [Puccinia graminis f. sp. tritici]